MDTWRRIIFLLGLFLEAMQPIQPLTEEEKNQLFDSINHSSLEESKQEMYYFLFQSLAFCFILILNLSFHRILALQSFEKQNLGG